MNRLVLALLVAIPGGSHPRLAGAEPVPVAHRGLFKHAPENTLPAFSACLDLRLGFELDVRRTRDGQLVCLHDDTLDRTTNGKGKVAEKSLRELRRLDAGSWFDHMFNRERIPTLEEVFALTADRLKAPTIILLDLKIDDPELPADIADLVATHRLHDWIICIGLAIESPDLRKRLKDADRGLKVAVLANKPEDLPAAWKDEHSDYVYVRFVPTAEQVREVRSRGKNVICVGPLFAGNEPDNWKKAAAAGAHAILTDYPLEMRAALRGK